MLKLVVFFSMLLPLGTGNYLEEIPMFSKESFFKEQVYASHNWKSFFQLKEVNQSIDIANFDLHLLNAAVFFATNKLRDKKGLKMLAFAPGLRDAAVVHTWQMVEKKFFDHINSKTKKLRTPDDRIKMFHRNFSALGENIDYNHISKAGQTTYADVADLIVDDFLHSAPHKKTMLAKGYNQLGCAAIFEAKPKDGFIYFKATQNYSLGN